MLPDDAPSASAHADQPELIDTQTGAPVTPPAPTGLVDQPVPGPVTVTGGGGSRRRGWPFAVAMALVVVLGGGALFLSGYTVGRDQALEPGTAAADRDVFESFWDVYNAIRQQYPLEPVSQQTLVEGAIRGMVEAVGDPYSSYLSPEDYRGTLDSISGTFEGIGAEIGTVDAGGNTSDCGTFGPNCLLVIIAPIDGSPAEAAGLKPGDVILKVDGSVLDGLTPDQARDRVRGAAGTQVTLHIQRFAAPAVASPGPSGTATPLPTPSALPSSADGASPGPTAPVATPAPRKLIDEFDVTVTRAKIQQREVTTRDLAGGSIGYIHLSGFSDNGADQLDAALKADVGKGVKKLVLDLRGNPGGFLTDARRVASAFIGSGPVFWEQDAQGNQSVTNALDGGLATDPSIKVVVLIDRGTASAAEIVAGAIQDRGRGQLIGETSFGKGTVQQWFDLGPLGGVKLTVDKWLTPNKRWIHKIGLTPDIAVTVPANNPPGSDPVLDKAIEVLGSTSALPIAQLAA